MIGIIKVVLLLSILFLNMQILNARGNASKIMTVYDFILNKKLYKDTKVMTLGYLRKINYMNEDAYYLFPTKDNAIISNTAAAIKLSFPNSREFKLISSCDENFVRIIGGVIANKSNAYK